MNTETPMPCVGVGTTCWAIGDGWIPPYSTGDDPALRSHESLCLLNTGERAAYVQLHLFFADREPAGPYLVTVPARRVRHVTLNNLTEPEPVPTATDFSALITSSAPIIAQHTRLDSRQPANALLSTIAFPVRG
ncbi:sensory rhodopsin transducer [Sciscionella marina]|uniref:sensory rhodopsin transducer n=1 Tax=Sciscionella marina TaxID=508770 RepID=UPI001F0916C8|nr:sensory rhodopsin transducer [Sciscionella marina]